MTEVLINGKKAVLKDSEKLKLNIENCFFEDSGTYTLDVTFPLDILENRQIFGDVDRMEVSKKYVTFNAAIIVDSKLVSKGTAKVTNINDSEVKLQILSGYSNVKFWTKAEKMYIDEFRYDYTDTNGSFDGFMQSESFLGTPLIKAGTFPGKKGVYCYVPTLDENGSAPVENCYKGLWNEQHLMINADDQLVLYHGGELTDPHPFYIEINRQNISPNLMFVAKWIFQHLGYRLNRNDRDDELTNAIYIANARNTTTAKRIDYVSNSADELSMAKALPHWTVEEFIRQLRNFLNVNIIFNDIEGTVDIVESAFSDGTVDITNDVEDEYEVEMVDDEDVKAMLYDSNVKYKKGESEYHDIDMVDQEVISPFRNIVCSREESIRQWEGMSDDERQTTIWATEEGQYCAKPGDDGKLGLARFNYFGALVRNAENDNDIELKISPVATTFDIEMPVFEYQMAGAGSVYRDAFQYRWTCKQVVVCLCNQYEAANNVTVWDAIHDTKDEGTEKEDIMQVFLMDGLESKTGFYYLTYQPPFTHRELTPAVSSDPIPFRRNWSLSLANDNTDKNIGKFHQTASRQNRNAEHRFRFRAKTIPSVYSVFLVRNKRYACKKLEVQFSSIGMEEIITGYFEEIL